MNNEDKTKYYLDLYGYIPWTITIANAFDAGLEWHRTDVAQALRNAQAEIDRLIVCRHRKRAYAEGIRDGIIVGCVIAVSSGVILSFIFCK